MPHIRVETHSLLDMKDLQKFCSPFCLSCCSSSSSSSSSTPNPLSIGAQTWKIAEGWVQEILSVIQPTLISDHRRKMISEYVQALIEDSLDVKVFPFGSVPLKTYLPDGDIDLTVFSPHNAEEDLMTKICSLLENEEKNNTQIQVRNVQCIPAQVKVVKCTVENISVDISFNQMAGLRALSFLQQVDLFIGKDNLFKCSLILIKAWCFYESRTLGATYGLIATYGLETMVLHIINSFHSSLHCPLAVLYRFLVYYSKFDWVRYCVSVNGPVLISSLPEIVVKQLDDSAELQMLSDDFFSCCKESFAVSVEMLQTRKNAFLVKHLNILDPLSDSNNLGRSISGANFYRIKSAFKYGSEKLGKILMLPPENMGKRLEKFFATTLERNGRGRRPDVPVPVPAYGAKRSEFCNTNGDKKNLLSGINYGLRFQDYGMCPVQPNPSRPAHAWKSACDMIGQKNRRYDQDLCFQWNNRLLPPVGSPNGLHVMNASPVEEKGKSRGTGTYIPRHGCFMQRDEHVRPSWKKLEFRVSKQLAVVNPPSETVATVVVSQTGKGGSGSLPVLSLKDFPLLPGSRPVTVSVNAEAWQPKDFSNLFENMEIGSFRSASPPVGFFGSASLSVGSPLPVSGEQLDFNVLATMDSPSSVKNPAITVEEKQDSPKEEVLDMPPFELGYEESSSLAVSGPVVAVEKQNAMKIEEVVVVPTFKFELGDENEFPPLVVSNPIAAAKQEKQNSANLEEEVVDVPPFRLEYDNDFPPLVSCIKLAREHRAGGS
ncbi:hypothetical protein Nepgr_032364 [Nepenthes gracilis]|uniref:Polymerase nucleotidyl transferase domain-containing protein n=1 Tax=Nepenthes gracilis TaxID=150966 RepID=A0AAD3TJW6_NEPGR|nr:hypothetical protein Nepgr_032364 [Nepenthes gracilis]